MELFRIEIRYPRMGSRVTLRTSRNWDLDLEPLEQGPEHALFQLEELGEVLEFKAVIHVEETFYWSRGTNYRHYPGTSQQWHYPHFFGHPYKGELSPVEQLVQGHSISFRVFTPPGYQENTLKRYPVLYMHDGTNLFRAEDAFLGREWQVDETMDLLHSLSIIDKIIVVGIYASKRNSDYTSPGYTSYARFLVERLKPQIDSAYRILPGPRNHAVMGSSLGGVLAFYMAWQYPDIFGKVACMSSTFGYADDLLTRVRIEPKRNLQIYLDSGWPNDNFEVTLQMRDQLLLAGYHDQCELHYLNFPLAEHNETYWANRLHVPIQLLFSRKAQGDPHL